MHRVWCRLCKASYDYVGNLPDVCPSCEQAAHWSSVEVPKKDYVLSYNDKVFLAHLKIKIDPDDDTNFCA